MFAIEAENLTIADARRRLAGVFASIADSAMGMVAIYDRFPELNESQPAGVARVLPMDAEAWEAELRAVADAWRVDPVPAPTLLASLFSAHQAGIIAHALQAGNLKGHADFEERYALETIFRVIAKGPLADPLADLDAGIRAWLVDEMGFEPELMGDGAIGLRSTASTDWSVLVTGGDGHLPAPDSWHVGVYAADSEGESECDFRHDGPGRLTLRQAVNGACSIVSEA